jgi:hypothetical protein
MEIESQRKNVIYDLILIILGLIIDNYQKNYNKVRYDKKYT